MSISWSCVSRDGVILAEAGEDDGSGNVIRTAQKIAKMRPTAGYEVAKYSSYKGLKFHLHEPVADDLDADSERIVVWAFCCVYNPKTLSDEYAKAFLTKIVYVTEPLRAMPWWRDGEVLSAQASFAPTLKQQMDNVEYLGRVSMLNRHVDETKQIMANNIENILERGEKIEDLQEQATTLNQMAQVFQKNSKKLKRFKMWQNAKHGVLLGTAITGVVGVVVIPPLIALL